MSLKSRIALLCACAALTAATAFAAKGTEVTVSPDPIQFPVVPLNSTGSLFALVRNPGASAVTISAITISGSNFAFNGPLCTGTLSPGQVCQMDLTFTPSAMGNIAATLVITEAGNGKVAKNPITIPLEGTGGNPIPSITSLSPPALYINSPTTPVTITGSGFVTSTLALLGNGAPLPTTFVSPTQIQVQIPGTALTNTGEIFLEVTNPQPGGGTATAFLQVVLQDPSINNVSPVSIIAGTPSQPILVNGQNFMAGAQVEWNGVGIPTTYLSSSQLQAQPTTDQLAAASLVQLAVTNPSPGTISPPVNFNVTYPITVTVLDLPANDLAWDPFAQLLYASLPSSFGANGNSIAAINPATGTVTGYFFAGSEPDKLALDSTSTFLYVGLNGNGSIQRLNLPDFTPDIQIGLGNNFNGPNLAGAVAVSPADPHTIAVALTSSSFFASAALEFFTDSTQLANSVTSEPMNQLAFASGTTLYGYAPNTLSQINVSSTGGTLGQAFTNQVTGNTFKYSGGLIFGSLGEEFNPATGTLLGTFDVGTNNGAQLLPDSAINRAFALGVTPFFSSLGITSYDLAEFTPIAVASLAELGSTFSFPATAKFLQTGPNSLAFIVTNNSFPSTTSQVVLVQSPTLMLAQTTTASPVPVVQSASPAAAVHGSANTCVMLQGSGFVPGSVVTLNNRAYSAMYVSANEMEVFLKKGDIAAPGTAQIQVTNPGPGGGTSSPVTFTIN